MNDKKNKIFNLNKQTTAIIIAMLSGAIFGLLIKFIPIPSIVNSIIVDDILDVGGNIFITLMKMMIVPLVMISLTCGICSLDDVKQFGKLGVKSLVWVVFTTMLAVIFGVIVANLFGLGIGTELPTTSLALDHPATSSFRQFFLDILPSNPIKALADGNMLQIIVFTILFALSINLSGERGKPIAKFFQDLNVVIMRMVDILIRATPYGVFCLMAVLFAKFGGHVILNMLGYFLTVILVLLIYALVVYSFLLKTVAKLNPLMFFRKMYSVMLFAFSVSSSNVSIPITLETAERKLGIKSSVASFVIPLGVNINKNGTAIMQGVAAIFIANAYNIHIGMIGYLMIVLTSTLATIGTAGSLSIGVFTLAIVLKQIGVPIEGLALIIGVDRLLDMFRTVVNVVGNATIACLVSKSNNQMDLDIYNDNKK
jgi:Na+/H+-dicarboxylate symporter